MFCPILVSQSLALVLYFNLFQAYKCFTIWFCGNEELPLEREGSKQKTPEEPKQDSDSSASSLEDASETDKKETVKKTKKERSKSEKVSPSNTNKI